jgi:polyhydroxyalkanoate synthesis regulator phasin
MVNTAGVVPSMALPFAHPMRGGSRKKSSLHRNMVGGLDSVTVMKDIYRNIIGMMQKRGKDLVDEDKKQIETAIKQIEENNRKLEKALKDLQAFVKLSEAVDVGISQVSLKDVENLSTENITSLRSTVSNLENCVGRVTRDQVGLMSSLINQVFRPMALLTIGAQPTQLRAL